MGICKQETLCGLTPHFFPSLLGPPDHGRRPRHRPERQDLRLLDFVMSSALPLCLIALVSFRSRPLHVLKRSTASSLFFSRLYSGHFSASHSQSASQGRAVAPPSTCMDTNVPMKSWVDVE